MTAREEFNQMLNACHSPRRIYNALFALAAGPDVKQANDMLEKRAIILSEADAIRNNTGLNKGIKQAV